ncbi:hypothetical protein P692DRAFT_20177027 [Suillus brevipes Sb2]|nr:hypothetical protein P692DRAFT_20177027 [Suillus brevipes Sb2]
MFRTLARFLCGGRDQGQSRGPQANLYGIAGNKKNDKDNKLPTNVSVRKTTTVQPRPPPDSTKYQNQPGGVTPRR